MVISELSEPKMKYKLTYGRTVNPTPDQTLRVEISQEFNDVATPWDDAYLELKQFVSRKIDEEGILQVVKGIDRGKRVEYRSFDLSK